MTRSNKTTIRLLEQLALNRRSDDYADEFPSRYWPPEEHVTEVPTLDQQVVKKVTPMLKARFEFCGHWKNPFTGVSWYNIVEMRSAVRDRKVRKTVNELRDYWDDSAPARFENSQLSVIFSTIGESIFLAWEKEGKEPRVYWYRDQSEEQFKDLNDYLKYCVS